MTAAARLHFLDALRVAALALLLPYHVGMAYVRWPWHVKASTLVPTLEPWMRAVNPWRMSLLFLVSGAVTALLLRAPAGAAEGWLRGRLKRLGLPLLAGVLVIVPPQSWLEVRERLGYAGSYVDFLGRYFRADGGFCDAAGACLVLPTWNHLWFLPYLMVYTTLLWAVLRRWPGALDAAARWLAPRLGGVALLLAPVAGLAALRLALRPHFDITHALVDDALGHAQYLPVFLLGAVFARTPEAWAALARWRGVALGLALAAWGLSLGPLEGQPVPLRIAFAVQQWCGVVAAAGYAWRWLNHDSPTLRWASARVFPVYVLHQTVLIALLVALRPLGLSPMLEAPLLLALTAALSLALAEALGRVGPLAPWLGWGRR